MTFNTDKFAAEIRRIAESKNALAVRAKLDKYLGKWGTQEHVRMRIARAIVDEEIDPFRVAELIGAAIARHAMAAEHRHYVHNPGAFVSTSIFREMRGEGRR